jgi:hypothetical protein
MARRKLVVLGGVIAAFACATTVWAYFTAIGTGAGSAAVATLASPSPVTATSPSVATAHVTWVPVASPSSTSTDVTYAVERSANGGASFSPAAGTCAGTLPRTTISCDDALTVEGDYLYRVTATFRTWTSTGTSSSVHVITDTTPPTSTIIFPADATAYNAAAYMAGCVAGTDELCGTASDPGAGASGVATVQVEIRRSSDSTYWNGSAWTPAQLWNQASGTTSWSYAFASSNLSNGVTYAVRSRAIDNASNTQSTPDAKSFTFDTIPPTVTAISRADASPTKATTLSWNVTFSEPVNNVAAANFALLTSGTAGTAPTITSVTASGGAPSALWSLTVSTAGTTGTNAATIGLSLSSLGTIRDLATNLLSASLPVVGQTYTFDTTVPTMTSIDRFSPSNPANASSVTWQVVFSENVSGVDAGDFAVAATGLGGTPAVTGVLGGPQTYTVTASTGSGNGTLGLNLVDDDSIADGPGSPLGGAGAGNGSFTGQVFTLDRTAPTISSITRTDASPANAGPLHWTVTFSEPVNNVANGSFGLTTSGITGTAPSVTSTVAAGGAPSAAWTVTVSTSGATGANGGSIQLKLTSLGTIQDPATNALSATVPVAGDTYTYDTMRPTTTSIVRAGASASVNVGPLQWSVTFSEPVSGVSNSNFTLATSGTAGTAPSITSTVASGGAPAQTWTVTASTTGTTGTNAGSIGLNQVSNTGITDTASNTPNQSVPITGQAYTFDTSVPTVTSINRADANPTKATTANWTVTFSEPVSNVTTGNFALVTSGTGGTTPSITAVSASTGPPSQTWNVAVSTLGTTGTNTATIQLNLSSVGTIRDAATNGLSATVPVAGQAYTFDTIVPTISDVTISGGAAGKPEQGDTIVITFSENVASSSICSTWTNSASTETISGNSTGAQVTITNNVVAAGGNDVVSFQIGSGSCGGAMHIGTINLGSANYVSVTMTFGTNGTNKDTQFSYNPATRKLTILLGQATGGTACTSGCPATSTAVYTPDPAIADLAGNLISGTSSKNASQF